MKNCNFRAKFALLLSLIFLAASMSVWTNVGGVYAEDDPAEYQKLYYISDYEGSSAYVNNVLPAYLTQVGLSANDIEYYYWPVADYFEDMCQQAIQWDNIENAYVIFEMRNELPIEHDNGGNSDLFVYFLRDTFYSLKNEQNCKLMIIFGTDEMAIAGKPEYTEFLTYADVVINTNMLYTFMYNVLDWSYTIYERDILDMNFLLSPGLCSNGNVDPDHYIFTNYFIPLYRQIYRSDIGEIYIPNQLVFDNYMDVNNRFLGWSQYQNMLLLDSDDIPSPVAFGIASDDADYRNWETVIYNLRQSWDFPVFVLNTEGVTVANWIRSGNWQDNIFYSGNSYHILNNYVPLIMCDFITGADLTQYNNWQGACDVTFKPILGGGNGWLLVCAYYSGWQRIINDEDAYYFWGLQQE